MTSQDLAAELKDFENPLAKTLVTDLFTECLISTSGHSASYFPAKSAWKIKYMYLQDNYQSKYSP